MKQTINEMKRMKQLAGLIKENEELDNPEAVQQATDLLASMYVSDFAQVLDAVADEYESSDFESLANVSSKIRGLSKALMIAAVKQRKEEEGF